MNSLASFLPSVLIRLFCSQILTCYTELSRPTSSLPVTDPSQSVQPDDPQPASTNAPAQPADELLRDNQASVVNSDFPASETIETIHVSGVNAVQSDRNAVSSPLEELSSETLADAKEHDDRKEIASTDQALEAALQEAVRAEADSHAQNDDDMDIEDFYAPDPSQLAPRTPTHAPEQIGSPEYSPTLDRTIPDPPGESDDYEPPEATPPIEETSAPDSPPFSPAPPKVTSEVDNVEDLDIDMPEFEPAPAANDVEQGHSEENLPSTNGSFPPAVEVQIYLLSCLNALSC